tara:strand:- start:11 stop:328 length:318 start_codon:yes stop_codon:yes gene_type:complete
VQELDLLVLLAVSELGASSLIQVHDWLVALRGGGVGCYDAVRIRVNNHLVPQGMLMAGVDGRGANGKMMTVYSLSGEAETLLVEMLALRVKSAGRVKLARKVAVS